MGQPVLERDLQELKDLEVSASGGSEEASRTLFFRLSELIKGVTKWQWIIHGDTLNYRQRCLRWLVRKGKFVQARRFAMCGRGDLGLLGDQEGGVRIKPKGCGARFCPRCSRRYGRRFLSRVASHLSCKPHGQLWHIVLTQRVIPEESLADARKRFEGAWKKMYRELRAVGMESALATYHVTPSTIKGWHFHCHLVCDLGSAEMEGAVYDRLDDAWFRALRDGESQRKPLFVRLVAPPGSAMVGLKGDRQMEFWQESRDPVETVLQYVLRDILQGVESWIGRMATDDQCESFAAALSGAKLHRLYGVWRTRLDEEVADEADDAVAATSVGEESAAKVKSATVWHVVGSMDEVLFWMRQRQAESVELVRRLLGRCSNKGAVASRLSMLVRECAL